MSGGATRPPATAPGRTLRSLSLRPVTELKSLTPKKAAALHSWGVDSVLDLVTTFPRRHLDRTRQMDVGDLAVGDEAVVMAEVGRVNAPGGRGRRSRVELDVTDGTGRVKVVFFNQPWRARQLPKGSEALFFGKVTEYRGTRQMVMPVVDLVVGVDDESVAHRRRTLRVVPVYPASGKSGLTSWEVGTWVAEALERSGDFADPLPEPWRTRLSLVDRTAAMWGYHLPETMDQVARRVAASPSTSCSACSCPWSCAAGPSNATPGPSATPSPRSTSPAPAVPAARARCSSPGPAWSPSSSAASPSS